MWLKLEGFMLSKIYQIEKDKYYIISYVESKKAILMETKSRTGFQRLSDG